jgi:hypothetical protein
MGKPNHRPQGVGAYEQPTRFNDVNIPKDLAELDVDKGLAVMDRREDPEDYDFKQMANNIEDEKQRLISRLDDAIKGGLFDQDTKDKLLMHVIQVVKEYYNRYKRDWDGLTEEERDATLRDVITHTYHSLVYKTNGISPSMMPTTRTKEQLEEDEWLRNNVKF